MYSSVIYIFSKLLSEKFFFLELLVFENLLDSLNIP